MKLTIHWPEWSDLHLARQAIDHAKRHGMCCIHMHGEWAGFQAGHLTDDNADCVGIVEETTPVTDVLRMIVRGKADAMEDEA